MPDPAVQVTELGFVDPMRLPSFLSRAAESFRQLPMVAKVFATLAAIDAVDLVLRRIGSISPGNDLIWVPGFIFAVAASVATLALPVVVWWRAPDVRRSRPLLARGAIAIGTAGALALVSRHVIQALIGDSGIGAPPTGQISAFAVESVVQIARALVEAAGFLWIAEGLRRLEPSNPSRTIRRAALIAAAITVGTALAALIWQLLLVPDQLANDSQVFGEPAILIALAQPISIAPTLAFGYVVWVLLRGIGGSDRRLAVRIGAIAAALATVEAVLELASIGGSYWFRSFANTSTAFDAALGWQGALLAVFTAGAWSSAIATVLFVTAFALGIHEPRPADSETVPA
jgi:hypothetical protein